MLFNYASIHSSTGIEKIVPVTLNYIEREHMMMLGTKLGYVDLFDFIPGLPAESLTDLFSSAQSSGSLKFVNLHWLRRHESFRRSTSRLDRSGQFTEG